MNNSGYASVFINRSGGDENPDIRYVGLFGESSDKKWLVTFANNIRNSENDELNESFRQTNTEDIDNRHNRVFIRNSMSESSRLRIRDGDDLFLSTGLHRIVKRSNDDRSIGIRFSYISNSDHRIREDMQNEEDKISIIREDMLDEGQLRLFESSSFRNTSNNTDLLSVDFSHTIFSSKVELINRLSYQYGSDDILSNQDFSSRSVRVDSLFKSDTTIIDSRTQRTIERRLFKTNNDAHLISYQGYLGKSLSLVTSDDYFFVDLRGGIGFGDITGRVENFLDRKTFFDDELIFKDTTNFDDSIDEDGNHYFADARIGFAVRKNWDKLYAYAGISPSFRYQKTDTESLLTTPSILEIEEERYNIKGNMPVLVQYRPKKWIDIYTFVNWGYRYRKTKRTRNELLAQIESGSFIGNFPFEYRSIEKTENSDFNTFGSFTFASTFKHPSGIRAQVAFLGDFANFNRWNLSLGYHF